MNWPSYQAFLSAGSRHIGLAPQLDTRFNKARSYTKFFDITQAGAVGVYAIKSTIADVIENGKEGMVIEMKASDWAEAILKLAEDPTEHKKMLAFAQKKVAELAIRSRFSYKIYP